MPLSAPMKITSSSATSALSSTERSRSFSPRARKSARSELHGLAAEGKGALLELRERPLLRLHLGGDLRAGFLERQIVQEMVEVVLGLHQLAFAIGPIEREEPVLHPAGPRDEHRQE